MPAPLRSFIRKAVRVVSSDSSSAPRPPVGQARLGPGPEAPVLDHRAGIDKVLYGSADYPACKDARNYTQAVNGTDYKIFFLCGHPRSGTHWMDGVLKLHPHIHIDGEYRFESLHNSLNDLTGKSWHAASREPIRSQAVASFYRSVREIIGASAQANPAVKWVGDRTPRPVRVFLPGAPHFLIIRDPRDILVSLTHQELKNAGFNYRDGNFDAELGSLRREFLANPDLFKDQPQRLLGNQRWVRRLVHRWRFHMRVDLDCLKRIDDAWTIGNDSPLPAVPAGESLAWNWQARVHVVRYENIHADPEGERAKLYRFLELDPSLASPLSDETKTKPGIAAENPHALYRKGEVGDWKKYFNDDVKRWFKDEANDTLVELGYETDDGW
jgi:Sulfotransferase domain